MTDNTHRPHVVRTLFSYIIPLIISVGLCYVLFRGVDLGQMWHNMQQCNFTWLLASLLFSIMAQVARAYRWRLQLRPIGVNPPTGVMINSIFGTYAVNLVLPRLGELWRTGYIAQRQNAPFASVFGSMIADRLADTLAVLIITTLTFAAMHSAMEEFASSTDIGSRIVSFIHSPWIWVAGIMMVMLVAWILKAPHKNQMLVKTANLIRGAWQGFASIARMPHKSTWLGLTALIWVSYFVEMLISMLAFNDTYTLLDTHGISAALITFVFGTIAMAIPSNGGIGPWQGAVVLALSGLYGLDHNVALSFATLSLGLQTLLTIVLGMYTFITIAVDKRRHNRTKQA